VTSGSRPLTDALNKLEFSGCRTVLGNDGPGGNASNSGLGLELLLQRGPSLKEAILVLLRDGRDDDGEVRHGGVFNGVERLSG
jgi:hypothetical protein